MRFIIMIFSLFSIVVFSQNSTDFSQYPIYTGNDLGATFQFQQKNITLKVWSPVAQEMILRIYDKGNEGIVLKEEKMTYDNTNGIWSSTISIEYENQYYTFQAKINDKLMNEVADPYAKSVGVNGMRGMLIDIKKHNPSNWNPFEYPLKNKNEIILYEAHIRDLSTHESSNIKNKGKFLGFTETKTKNKAGFSTGLDHIAELGITHIHVLPSFDYKSIDETRLAENHFNWGYDPQNYNAPEGSYSSNPYDGKTRVLEFKEMVQAIHNKGIAVVMDVVYNHTGSTEDSNFNQLMPGYYYRQWNDGKFSNASACGNEIASERYMVRKFMIESLIHWLENYNIDGFRFDLMAIHDIETMNIISETLHKLNPNIFLYGEGWTAGDSPLPLEKRALKQHEKQLHNVSVFSDDIRDGIKGHWSNVHEKGFVSGNPTLKEVVKFGIVASTQHNQVQYSKERSYAQFPYANEPAGVIGYVSCHDNNTLYDKLKIANPETSEQELEKMDKLANTIVFTSQSIPFLHMGAELKRTKKGVENSYNASDAINQINWDWKTENYELFTYYKNLIKLRKMHPAFRMKTQEVTQKNLTFIDNNDHLLIEYTLKGSAVQDQWKNIYVAYNGDSTDKNITLPTGKWKIVLNGKTFDFKAKNKAEKTYKIPARSAVILVEK